MLLLLLLVVVVVIVVVVAVVGLSAEDMRINPIAIVQKVGCHFSFTSATVANKNVSGGYR